MIWSINMDKDIVKYPDIDSATWQDAINQLTETLIDSDVPERVVKIAEMLVAGFPMYKIAKKIGVKTSTVKSYIKKYPAMASAVARARSDLSLWRMAQMEQQFVQALETSEEVFTADDSTNAKLLGIKAQHARYVLSLFFGNKLDINIKISDETPLLKASKSALDYVVDAAKEYENEDTIEATVRIIEDGSTNGPLLDEEGNPNHGVLGELDVSEEGIMCHVCGVRFERLDIHIRVKEKLSSEMYETIFMLSPGTIADTIKGINEYDNPENEEDRDFS
jgi:hypothetical protein